MFAFINIPARVIGILEANISPREIAAGVCLGAFLGLIPLNGPMALLLTIFFFVFRINRISTILTLPLFKMAYVFGLSGVSDSTGAFLLENVNFLKPFWTWLTHLPIIAYLDINNTLVAGGLAVAAVVSVPIYFVSKMAAAAMQKQYAAKMKNSIFSKITAGIKTASVFGPDAASTLSNVTVRVKLSAIARAKAFFSKGKPGAKGFLKRHINIPGIIMIVAALAVLHFGTALILSPLIGPAITEAINKSTPAKVKIDKITVWPLTLSFSLNGLTVFDPETTDKRIIKIDKASVRISPMALLSRRLVLSSISGRGAEVNLEGSPDTGFNISRAVGGKAPAAKTDMMSMLKGASEKKDFFGKIYGVVKKRFAKKDPILLKAERASAAQVTTNVVDLPKGKLVRFVRAKDQYLFEVRSLRIDDADIKFRTGGEEVDIADARIGLGGFAFDPEHTNRLNMFDIKGTVKKAGNASGTVELYFEKGRDRDGENMRCDAKLEDVDLDAVRFVYEDSLPVSVLRGRLTLSSRTSIAGGAIDSRNSIALTGHELQAKGGSMQMVGVIPVVAVVEALNSIDPVKLKFEITGSVEKPQFGGFQDSLTSLVKPYIGNIQKKLVSEGMNVLDKFLQKQMGDKRGE